MALLEIELEGCLDTGVDPLAYATACAQAAAIVFGHYHRVLGSCDDCFREQLQGLVVRFMNEASAHRQLCAEQGAPAPVPDVLVSRLTH